MLIGQIISPDFGHHTRRGRAPGLNGVQALESLDAETASESSRKLIKRALYAIEITDQAFRVGNPRSALPDLIRALNKKDIVLNYAATWALAELGTEDIIVALEVALTHRKNLCARAQRIRDTIERIRERAELKVDNPDLLK